LKLTQRIAEELNHLKSIHRFRELKSPANLIDFSSNDYLGFAKDSETKDSLVKMPLGSTGSRLITGNSIESELLENEMATFFETEAALIFNSGYLANLGLLSCIAQRNDVIIYDQLVHASIRDGILLSKAKNYSFSHNNYEDLEKKLQIAKANIDAKSQVFIVIESVYSMDGDSPDLKKVVDLCSQYDAEILLDEAHALGTVGTKGEGLAQLNGFHNKIFARIFTFGKALGCEGAVIVGSTDLRNYLINFCRPFIFSTAPSPLKIDSISIQWKKLMNKNSLNQHSTQLKTHFIQILSPTINIKTGDFGNIIMVLVSGNENAKKTAQHIQKNGFDVRAILSPTVPVNSERLRICFHEFNTFEEVTELANLLNNEIKL
jgi:8-amino-7-oxononanoate synthase